MNKNSPDWLSRIRSRVQDEQPSSADLFSTEETGSDEPDWLKGVSGDSDAAPNFNGDGEDWLSRLGSAETPTTDSQPPSNVSADLFPSTDENQGLADWLSNLNAQDAANDEKPVPPSLESDWATDFRGLSFPDEPALPAQAPDGLAPEASGDDQDDWLSKLSDWQGSTSASQSEEPEAFSTSEASSAAWSSTDDNWDLSALDLGTPSPSANTDGPESAALSAAEDMPDWQNFVEGDLPAAAAGLPNWLNSFDAPENASVEERAQPDEISWDRSEVEQSAEDLPDWLRSTPSEPVETHRAASLPETFAPSGDLPEAEASEDVPDWLRGFSPDESAAAAAESSSEQAGGDLPMWLKEDAVEPVKAPEEPVHLQPDEAAVPDWLSAFDGPKQIEEEDTAPQFANVSNEEDVPDWLKGSPEFLSAEPEAPAAFVEPVEADEGSVPAWLPAFADEPAEREPALPVDEQPDWMQAISAVGREDQAEVEATSERPAEEPILAKETGPLPFIDENLPDWLSEFQGQPPSEGPTIPPLIEVDDQAVPVVEDGSPFNVDLPEWLSEEASQENAAVGEPALAAANGDDLTQADLPSWVEAMRPLEFDCHG